MPQQTIQTAIGNIKIKLPKVREGGFNGNGNMLQQLVATTLQQLVATTLFETYKSVEVLLPPWVLPVPEASFHR
ncbi:MAG: hypothetical protein ACTS73_02750 [Arsenophonus sp. NEOnobi-MAG3]